MQKHKRALVLGLLVVMLASMVAIATSVASAQADVVTLTKVEFVGTVEAFDATTVTVNGHIISLATAEVQGALTIGAIVKVEAMIDAGGNFTATEVKPVTEADRGPQELELHGQISAINGTTFTVAGLTFDTLNAKIEGNPQVGDQVEVKLILSNGLLVASQVQAHSEDNGILQGNDTLGNDTLENDLFGNDTLGNDTLNNEDGNDFGSDDNSENLGNDTLNNEDNGNELGDDNGNDVFGNDTLLGNDDHGNDTLGNDNHEGEDAKLVGTLEQVGDGFIVVNGQQITLVNASIETQLIVGTTVSVEVTNVGGVLTAHEVKNAADDHSGQGGGNSGPSSNSGSGGGDCGSHDGWSEYHVRSGDTLSGIASRSGASMNDIASSNCIDNPNHIRTGETILVPNGSTLDNEANDDHGGGNSGRGSSGRNGGNANTLGNDNSGDNSDLTSGNDDGIGHDANDDNGNDSVEANNDNGGQGGQGSDDGAGHDANDDHGGDSGSGGSSASSGGSGDSGSHDSGGDNGGDNGGDSGGDSGGHGGHDGGGDD